MKVYYFLNNISKESFNLYLSKFDLLKGSFTVSNIVDKFYSKIWIYNKDFIQDANFLEALSFIEFLKKKNDLSYEEILKNITWIHDDNFFIYNEKVYIQWQDKYIKIDTKNQKVYFVTSRDLFTSPFFLILNSLSKIDKNIKIVKPNIRLNDWSYNDKVYYISKLYKHREKMIWNIIFPLFQNKEEKNIKLFFENVKLLLWNEVMIKKNFWDMWKWLKAMRLDEISTSDIELLKWNFFSDNNNFTWFYIVPFIDIKKEYRVYYRYDENKDKASIYSIKNRVNTIWDDIFYKPDFKLYDNVKVEWLYMKEEALSKKYIDIINKICKITKDNIGVLEFYEDENWKIYFCEINSLWGSLMFFWQDEKDMIKYYTDTRKMIY